MIGDARARAQGDVDTASSAGDSRTSTSTPYELLLALRQQGIEVRSSPQGLLVRASPTALEAATHLRQLETRREEIRDFLGAVPHQARTARSRESKTRLRREPLRVRAPLTHSQRRLWMLGRLSPESTAYNLPYAFRFRGQVSATAVERALVAVVGRHDALRASIVEDEQGPCLQVHSRDAFVVQTVDLRSAPERLDNLLAAEAVRPFRFEEPSLFRAMLVLLDHDELVLFFNLHHVVGDGWSIEVLLDELVRGIGEPSGIAEPPVGFVDFAAYEHARLLETDLTAELERASKRLAAAPPLELPTDHVRRAVLRYRGRTYRFVLEAPLVRCLREIARAESVTFYMLMLAAYKVLLARFSNQTDISVGSPIAGRHDPEVEQVIGFFANTIVQRTDLAGEPSFRELLQRVNASCLAAFEDQQLPFDRLVEVINPARDRSRTPIFQAMFTLQETHDRRHCVRGVELERMMVDSGGAKTDLTLLLEDDGSELVASLEYNSDLFEAKSIERMGRSFHALLSSIATDPAQPITRLSLLTGSEAAEIFSINETARALPPVFGFHELIERQVRNTPDRTAVIDDQGTLSYFELEAEASSWAARLYARGVRGGSRVGVSIGRSRMMLPVLLGVLKTGAAYVPLDPTFPKERLAYMVEDAGLRWVVTERALAANLPDGDYEKIVRDEASAQYDAAEPAVIAAEDTAYVIYTSGSTGQPKGVQVPHRAVVNFLESMAREPGCTLNDRVVALTTLSFDIAVLELFLPLTVGAATVVASSTAAKDGAELARLVERHSATLLQATPATWRLLLESAPSLRIKRAISGGEPFPVQLARELLPRCDEVWNGYGPTETTVYSTFFRVIDPEAPILIGRPIANTQVYVLDRHLAPVPDGVMGELYIGGDGVTTGYLNKPELTRERFLPNPFVSGPQQRMYRTGDLARLRENGVQFLGRADDQVKLRGYRIELGEIESVMSQDPAVAHCVVAVREFGPDDKRLVAYVVWAEDLDPNLERLQSRARQQLPDYMVPRHIVELKALPLMPNRKVDRKALPAPFELKEAGAQSGSPGDATEELLATLWSKVLGVPEVGVDSDFFSLGGHSLLALQLLREINRACGTDWPLSMLFEATTVREQARIMNRGELGGKASVVPLAAGANPLAPALFCICGINLYQNLAKRLGDDRSVYGVFLPIEEALLQGREVDLSVRDMSRDYVTAIRERQPRGPYHLVGVSFGGILAFEVAHQLVESGEEVGVLGLLDVMLDGSARLSPSTFTRRIVQEARGRSVRELLRAGMRLARSSIATIARSLPEARPPAATHAALRHSDVDALRLRSYRRAFAEYEPKMEPYSGEVLVFRAAGELRKFATREVAEDYGWSRFVRGVIRCHDVPGDHLGILSLPHVDALARLLRDYLSAADGQARRSARAANAAVV